MTVSEILMQDLGMKHVVAKFILCFCYQSRRNITLQLLMYLIQTATSEPDFLIKKVPTRDES